MVRSVTEQEELVDFVGDREPELVVGGGAEENQPRYLNRVREGVRLPPACPDPVIVVIYLQICNPEADTVDEAARDCFVFLAYRQGIGC